MRCIYTSLVILAVGLLQTAVVHGQDRPTVFQHGLASGPDTWRPAAASMQALVAIEPHVTTTDWWKGFDEQARQLDSQLPASGLRPVAVGHSNGGLVSREWSKSRSVEGIVTLGTPHQGAPLLLNAPWLGRYYSDIVPRLMNLRVSLAPAFDEWDWVGPAVWPAASFASLAAANARHLINRIVPVIPEMMPGSVFLSDLNSSGNISREAAQIPYRVGIVAWDPNHYKGGPFRLASATVGDGVHTAMKAATVGLLMYGSLLLGNAVYDPSDPDKYFRAMERAIAIMGVAAWLIDFNPAWCVAISSAGAPRCAASDGLVPFDSQYYPGAQALLFPGGPVHTAQTRTSDAKLYEALTGGVHLAPRAGGGQ
jgi:pimeloyl-ACP methyl ester carboxylesterase